MAAGAMGTPPTLLRSKPYLPALSSQLGQNLGVNGDHVAAIEFDPAAVQSVLGLRDYHQFYVGKPITTMSYDWWVGRRSHVYDGTRFNLQEIFLKHFFYQPESPKIHTPVMPSRTSQPRAASCV